MLLERQIVKFSNQDSFSQYCKEISETFCPYIKPAEERNCLYLSSYTLTSDNQAKIQEEIFYLSIAHTEMLRKQRRFEMRPDTAILVCDNMHFSIKGAAEQRSMEKLLSWPHWMLKNLYVEIGFLFGKFAIGQKRIGRSGEQIPEPPQHFMSIRTLIKERDPQFFTKSPELLSNALSAIDNGRNIHEPYLNSSILEDVEAMRSKNYFKTVLKRLSSQLDEAQRQGAEYLLELI
jgi:hypothetical protein